jgi:hypothetical protein
MAGARGVWRRPEEEEAAVTDLDTSECDVWVHGARRGCVAGG